MYSALPAAVSMRIGSSPSEEQSYGEAAMSMVRARIARSKAEINSSPGIIPSELDTCTQNIHRDVDASGLFVLEHGFVRRLNPVQCNSIRHEELERVEMGTANVGLFDESVGLFCAESQGRACRVSSARYTIAHSCQPRHPKVASRVRRISWSWVRCLIPWARWSRNSLLTTTISPSSVCRTSCQGRDAW